MQDWPRNDQVLRVDYNIAPHTTVYGRLQCGYEKRAGGVSFLGAQRRLAADGRRKYEIDTVSYVNTLLHTFNPTTFAEFTIGVNWSHQYTSGVRSGALDANDRRLVLPGFRQFFPEANPLQSAAAGDFHRRRARQHSVVRRRAARWPFFGYNTLFNVSGNLTKLKGAHNMKTGLFVEHTTRPAQRSSAFNGNLSFNIDGSNPLNTNIGFANALLGAVNSTRNRTPIRRRTDSS